MSELVKLPVIFIMPAPTVFTRVPLKVTFLNVVPRPPPHDIACAVPLNTTVVELVVKSGLLVASLANELVKLPPIFKLFALVPFVVFASVPERVKLL